jgi:hypothetical protein
MNGRDTLIAYTPNENRKIALIMLHEEELNILYNRQLDITQSLTDELFLYVKTDSVSRAVIDIQEDMIAASDSTISDLNDVVIRYEAEVKEKKSKIKQLRSWVVGSIGLNVLLVVLLL